MSTRDDRRSRKTAKAAHAVAGFLLRARIGGGMTNVVIQCAGRKWGNFFASEDGHKVFFVADPAAAPRAHGVLYAHPDGPAAHARTWREVVLCYNERPGNPLNLARAFELYANPTYERLVSRFGVRHVFILSAGWGLIRADFLTPYYDITFSSIARQKGAAYKFRDKRGVWRDFCHLPPSNAPLVFFGGRDYLPLFCTLTRTYPGERAVFYNSALSPAAPGCRLRRYATATRTNWHYECANAFLEGMTTMDGAVKPDPRSSDSRVRNPES